MITVTLSYPNRQQQNVLLAGIPRRGEHIRLANGPGTASLLVEQVVYVEANHTDPAPTVLIVVSPYTPGPEV